MTYSTNKTNNMGSPQQTTPVAEVNDHNHEFTITFTGLTEEEKNKMSQEAESNGAIRTESGFYEVSVQTYEENINKKITEMMEQTKQEFEGNYPWDDDDDEADKKQS